MNAIFSHSHSEFLLISITQYGLVSFAYWITPITCINNKNLLLLVSSPHSTYSRERGGSGKQKKIGKEKVYEKGTGEFKQSKLSLLEKGTSVRDFGK